MMDCNNLNEFQNIWVFGPCTKPWMWAVMYLYATVTNVSILPPSVVLIFDFGTVPTVWYWLCFILYLYANKNAWKEAITCMYGNFLMDLIQLQNYKPKKKTRCCWLVGIEYVFVSLVICSSPTYFTFLASRSITTTIHWPCCCTAICVLFVFSEIKYV